VSGLIWLEPDTPLPEPDSALPEGLLAAGGDLSVARLTEAYSKGIFPWFNQGDPVLWWSPNPRMVLTCSDFRVSHSLRKKLRQVARLEDTGEERVIVTTDLAFGHVIRACAAPRASQNGTWISNLIINAYSRWHASGQVHSIETWIDGTLAGGLYGVCLGGFFFGESMFARVPDASKIALAYLVGFLERHGITHVDCQQDTQHLSSLGGRTMSRAAFMELLSQALQQPSPPWQAGRLLHDGRLRPFREAGPDQSGSTT
jgi:leucyl/phenylalanyl-tRNA--protein transferase